MIDAIQYKSQGIYGLEITNAYTIPKGEKINPEAVYSQGEYTDGRNEYVYGEPSRDSTSFASDNDWSDILDNIDKSIGDRYQDLVAIENISLAEFNINKTSSKAGTEEHKKEIMNKSKIDRVKEHHDSMYLYGLQTQEDLTLNNLYKGSFSGVNKNLNKDYTDKEISQVLELNSIPDTKINKENGRKLLELQVELTEDALVKVQNIHDVVEKLEYDEIGSEDGALMEGNKVVYHPDEIDKIKDMLGNVDQEDVQELIDDDKEITIGNLKESMLKNTEKILKLGKKSVQSLEEAEVDGAKNIEDITAQIKEIRAKLNVESAQKLSGKMPLESSELIKVAEALRQIEDEVVTEAIEQVDLPPTKANKEVIKQIMQAATAMTRNKEQAIQLQLETDETATLEEIYQVIEAYEDSGTVAEKRFGETINKVSKQIQQFLGNNDLPQDKLTVEAGKALILSGMDLTEENLEGVKQVLEKTNIVLEEMTPQRAATLVKEGLNPYKASVNHIVDWIMSERLPELKDIVAGAIIALEDKKEINQVEEKDEIEQLGNNIEINEKQGLVNLKQMTEYMKTGKQEIEDIVNPIQNKEAPQIIEGSVEQLEGKQYFSRDTKILESENVEEFKNKVAKSIVSLEDKGKINEVQKKSLVGLYRILHAVQSSKEEVVGYLYKNKLPLTIERLEEAVKYVGNQQTIATTIDDEFGVLESVRYDRKSARIMIDESKHEGDKVLEIVQSLEGVEIAKVDGERANISKISSMIYPLIKSTIKKELGKFGGLDTLPETLLNKIDAVKNTKPEVLELMMKKKIALTLSNIYWIDELIKSPDKYKELLSDSNLEQEEFPENVEVLEEEFKRIEEEVLLQKEECMQQGNMIGYKEYKKLAEMVNIQKQLMDKQGIYQIPFIIHGETKMVHFYVNQDKKKEDHAKHGLTTVIIYNTKALGQVMARLKLKGDNITCKICAENSKALKILAKEAKYLEDLIYKIGYNIYSVEYVTQEIPNIIDTEKIKSRKDDSKFEVII